MRIKSILRVLSRFLMCFGLLTVYLTAVYSDNNNLSMPYIAFFAISGLLMLLVGLALSAYEN